MTVVKSLGPLVPAAAKVGARSSLKDVRLWSLRVEQANDDDLQGVAPSEVAVHTSVETTVLGDWSPDFQVRLDYVVRGEAVAPESVAGTQIMLIDASWVLDYQVTSAEGLDEENLKAFGAVSGAFAGHTYMRELVQGLTGRMGLPPLVLDVMTSPLDEAAKILATGDDSGQTD